MMLKSRLLGLFVLLLLLSCSKDELVQPVTVELLMEMEPAQKGQESSDIDVNGGRFLLSEIGFDGYRESGENYFFTKSFPDSLKISFSKEQAAHVLNFQMPQGVYNRIDIKIEVPAGKEAAAAGDLIDRSKLKGGIELWGHWVNVHGVKIPFLFIYTAVDELKITAKSASGSQQVVVKNKSKYQARLRFNPQQWMELINTRMLQSAKLSVVNGSPTVVISKSQNEQVYNLLANRIEQSSYLLIE